MITFSLNSFYVRNYSSNEPYYEDCNPVTNGEYNVLKNLLQPNSVVFDIGANVGDYTNYIISLNRTNKIYCFEPVLDVFNLLKEKLSYSNTELLKPQLFNFGFYKNNTTLPIWYAYTHSGLSSIYDRSNQPIIKKIGVMYKKIEINLKTVDDFCSENEINFIDFMKIDTEGAEYDVLLGAVNMISKQKIGKIQFEYGGCYLDANCTLKQVYNYLTSHNYLVYKIVPDGLLYIDEWSDLLEDYKYSNFLALS